MSTAVSLKMTKEKDTDTINGQIKEDLKVGGTKINNTVLVCSLPLKSLIINLVCGKWEEE
jgi:hypothetical protein